MGHDALDLLAEQQYSLRSNDLVTEDNAAQRFVDRYASLLRYCHDRGAWFKFEEGI